MSAIKPELIDDIAPIGRREATVLAAEEYRRFAEVLVSVRGDAWEKPTDCAAWTVRDLAGHVVGAMRSAASLRELLGQQREVARRCRLTDADETEVMTDLQVEITAGLDAAALVAECLRLAPRAAAGRRRLSRSPLALVRFPVHMGEIRERWTLGYLVDVVLTRDTWLHRIDLCRAVGHEIELDARHDGRIVGDVVAEWSRRHGQPVDLELGGPAGGRFVATGSGTTSLSLDAVEFCRTLSGRERGAGLLGEPVPF